MTHLGTTTVTKAAFAAGGMGLTALVALTVGGPLAAATVAVAGRVLGEALGESGKELTKTFMEKASDYFFDTAGDPLIGGFRVEHPTLEDIYRRALQLSLLSLKPLGSQGHGGIKNSEEDTAPWFEHWDLALKTGMTFSLESIKLPKNEVEAEAAFQATMEILAAQGAQRRQASQSLLLKVDPVPADLFTKLKAELPDKLDHFFNGLLVKEENTSAYKEHDLVFKKHFLTSFARLETKIDVISQTTSVLPAQIADVQQVIESGNAQIRAELAERAKLDEAMYGMLAEILARQRKADPEVAASVSSTNEQAVINRAIDERPKVIEEIQKSDSPVATANVEQLLREGKVDEAARAGQTAFEAAEKAYAEQGRNLAQACFDMGRIHELSFRWSDALENYRRAWELSGKRNAEYGFKYAHFSASLNKHLEAIQAYEAVVPLYSGSSDRARTLNNLAILYSATQRLQEAERDYGESLTIYRQLADSNPDAYLPDVAMTLNNLAVLYIATQRLQQAERDLGESLVIRRQLAESNPDAYLPDVAMTLNNLANLYSDTQRLQEAERDYGEALTIYRQLADSNPGAYLPTVAMTLNNLALLYGATQRLQQAERDYGESLAIRRQLAKSNPDAYLPDVATTLHNLAYLLITKGQIEIAAVHASEASAILHPQWQANPELHGNLMARILWTSALIAQAGSESIGEACALARRALAAAWDPSLKDSIQQLIASLCASFDS